jgi:rod shape determining protein RodA
MLFLPVFFGVAFLAGVPFRNLALVAAAGCVLLVGAWLTPGVLHDYQKRRLTAFINPGANPHSAAAYNARQATLAVAGGGWTGQGWGEGVLNRMRRIPERHTDFIFPVIAEEWGFVRSTAFIAFYLLLLGLIARIAWDTHGQFGRLLVGGILTLLAVQGLLHLAISLRLAPITGLTLPFISYGGSSLVVSMAGLGLVAGVRIRSEFVPSQRSY